MSDLVQVMMSVVWIARRECIRDLATHLLQFLDRFIEGFRMNVIFGRVI